MSGDGDDEQASTQAQARQSVQGGQDDRPGSTDGSRNDSGHEPPASGASRSESHHPGAAPAAPARRGPISLKVEYKRLNTFFYDYTKNISRGGTFINTDRPLEVGTVFVFRLVLPVATDPIELRGEVRAVVRPGEASAGQKPGMGIRFVFSDGEDRYRLERKVEKLMVDSLGQLAYSRLMALDSTGGGPRGAGGAD